MRIHTFFLLASVAIPLSASSGKPAETLEHRRDRLYQTFLAPCCWHESVYVHRSSESLIMRKEIDAMLVGGQTDQVIIAHFVKRYGERILR